MNPNDYDLAVAGGGIAALTAAWHAAQHGARVIVFSGSGLPGGLVANIGKLEGFPSITPTSGIALAEHLRDEAQALGASFQPIDVEFLSSKGAAFVLRAAARDWRADKVIAATGARLKPLEVPGAERFRDNGVLQCAWCNAGLFRGRQVAVVGAGDAAFQEAVHLARSGARVTMIMRGEQVRARQTLVEQVAADETVQLLFSSEVTSVSGADRLTGVVIRDVASGNMSSLTCDAVFPYVGLQANADWLGDLVDRGPDSTVVTDARLRTKTPGLFAVGALRQGYGGRLTDAIGDASAAVATVFAVAQ